MNLPTQSDLETLSIRDRAGEIIPLRLNSVQKHLLEHLTGRDIVIKARQTGISTLVTALNYLQSSSEPEFVAITRPQHFSSVDFFRRKVEVMREYDPRKPDIYIWDKYYYRFSKLGSYYHIGMRVPHATTIRFAHLSELAYWDGRDYDEDFRHIEESVPSTGQILIESTSNPYNARWFWLCVNALLGKNDYTVHFYEWWWNPEYCLPLEKGGYLRYDDDENDLFDNGYGLSIEQLNWRGRMIAEMGYERFHYEYPERLDTVLGLGLK